MSRVICGTGPTFRFVVDQNCRPRGSCLTVCPRILSARKLRELLRPLRLCGLLFGLGILLPTTDAIDDEGEDIT